MALRHSRKRRKASITSLIDVIFLLLLFFMLASTFSKFSEIEVSTTRGEGSETPGGTVFQLHIGETALSLDGAPVSPETVVKNLTHRAGGETAVVAVSVSGAATTQMLTDVLVSLNTAKNVQIHVLEPAT